jgi:hypothetical protein
VRALKMSVSKVMGLAAIACLAGCSTEPMDVEVARRASEVGRGCMAICSEITYTESGDPEVTYELDDCTDDSSDRTGGVVMCHLTRSVRTTAFH